MMSQLRNREESLRSSGEREKYQTQQRGGSGHSSPEMKSISFLMLGPTRRRPAHLAATEVTEMDSGRPQLRLKMKNAIFVLL